MDTQVLNQTVQTLTHGDIKCWTGLKCSFETDLEVFNKKESAISKIPSSEPSTASVGKWKIHRAEISIRKKVIFLDQISTRNLYL